LNLNLNRRFSNCKQDSFS